MKCLETSEGRRAAVTLPTQTAGGEGKPSGTKPRRCEFVSLGSSAGGTGGCLWPQPGALGALLPRHPQLGEANGEALAQIYAHLVGCLLYGQDVRKDFFTLKAVGHRMRLLGARAWPRSEAFWQHSVSHFASPSLRDTPEDPCRCLPPIYFSEKPWLLEAGGTAS